TRSPEALTTQARHYTTRRSTAIERWSCFSSLTALIHKSRIRRLARRLRAGRTTAGILKSGTSSDHNHLEPWRIRHWGFALTCTLLAHAFRTTEVVISKSFHGRTPRRNPLEVAYFSSAEAARELRRSRGENHGADTRCRTGRGKKCNSQETRRAVVEPRDRDRSIGRRSNQQDGRYRTDRKRVVSG